MERIEITIQRLGAIRDSSIEITPVMIFSGESGLGKSYAAMLCHYIFDVLLDNRRIDRFFSENEWRFGDMRQNLKTKGHALSIVKEELEKWLSKDAISYLRYMVQDESLEGDIRIVLPESVPQMLEIDFEEEIVGIVDSEEVYLKLFLLGLSLRAKEETINSESPFALLLRYALIKTIYGSFRSLTNTYVFPPSRGPMLTEEIIPRTGLYERFKKTLNKIDRISDTPEEQPTELTGQFRRILDGQVYRKEGKYFYTTHNKVLPISAAAASIREIAPLALLAGHADIHTTALFIEEPEAHLHPLKQRNMADITSLLNTAGAYMQITTHSDYFLRRINELIHQKKLHEKCLRTPHEGEEKYQAYCTELNLQPGLEFQYDRLSAYLLIPMKDGTSRIERQDVTEGIPFASFSKAIDESLQNLYRISDLLDDERN